MKLGKQEVSLSEYAYLNAAGNTVWGTVSAHTQNIGAEEADALQLGGRLPIYQMSIEPFLSYAVTQAQRGVNLSGTMLTRNNNLAGSRERMAIGVEPPGEWTDSGETDEQGRMVKTLVPKEIKTGAGTFNFFNAQAIHDSVTGNITAYANPNIIFTDPVPIDTFVGTSEYWRRAIYAKFKQLHILSANDGRINGVSRTSMRKEFQASLEESKGAVDAASAWIIEIALNIAAHFIGQPGKFLNTKAVFNAQISTVELTAEERSQIVTEFQAGVIDHQTALELLQYKNVKEIIERLKANPKLPQSRSPIL